MTMNAIVCKCKFYYRVARIYLFLNVLETTNHVLNAWIAQLDIQSMNSKINAVQIHNNLSYNTVTYLKNKFVVARPFNLASYKHLFQIVYNI